jgi:hypothetical protein
LHKFIATTPLTTKNTLIIKGMIKKGTPISIILE